MTRPTRRRGRVVAWVGAALLALTAAPQVAAAPAAGAGAGTGATSRPSPAATGTSPASPSSTRVCTPSDRRLLEQSGAAASVAHEGVLWLVSDSGSDPEAYAVSTRTCRVRAVLRMAEVDARDIEAMTVVPAGGGRGVLVLADTGDNRRVRTSVVLRFVAEPRRVADSTQPVTSLRVRYADGPRDVEAVAWTPDRRLLLVTKDLLGAEVLQVPAAAVTAALGGRGTSEPVVAQRVGRLPQGVVTDAAALPDGRLVVRGYGDASVYARPAYDGGLLTETARLALPDQAQGETLAVVEGGAAVVVGSEGSGEPLWRVPVPRPGAGPSSGGTGAAEASRRPLGVPTDRPSPGPTGAQLLDGVGGRELALLAALVLAGAALPLAAARRRRRR